MVALSSVEASLTITLTVPICGVGVGVCVGVSVVALLELPQPVDRTIIEAKASPGKQSRNETLHCILLERPFRLSIVFSCMNRMECGRTPWVNLRTSFTRLVG